MKYRIFVTISLFLFCLLLSPLFSFAQEEQPQAMDGDSMVIASPSPSAITPTPDYPMPYPGLLPDSPLYILKTMRDRLISIVIGDALKKAEFDVLQSDKRIGAAVVLLESGNSDKQMLAVSTVSKGLNYFDEAIQKASEAKKQGDGVTDIKSRMKNASKEYIYLLQKAEKKTGKDIDAQLDEQIKRLQQLTQQLNRI